MEQGKYIITIVNRTYTALDLYLQNSTDASLVLLKVKDKFGNNIQNAEITIQRWNNNTWRTEQIVSTDFQGQSEGYYVLSTTYYNHIISYNGITYLGAINNDADKKIIYAEDVSTGLTFYIDLLGVNDILNYQRIYNTFTNISYINQTNHSGYFRYYFDEKNNNEVKGCLRVRLLNESAYICNSCTTTATGTIICAVNQTLGTGRATYLAEGGINNNWVDEIIKVIGVSLSEVLDWGATGYVIGFLLVVVSFFMFSSSPTLAIITGTLVFIVLSGFGLMFKDVNYAVFIILMAISFLVARIKSEGGLNG